MKKLIAMIATVAVVLSMGVTAMADAIDKTEKKSPEAEKIVSEVSGEADYEAIFTERDTISGAQYAGLNDVVKDGQKARVFDVDVYGIKLERNDQGLLETKLTDDKDLATDKGGSFDIAVTFDGAGDVINVLLWDGEMQKWSDVIAWEVKDGKVTFTTGRDGVFAFVMAPEADDAEEAKEGDAAKSGGKKSAATGYNSTAYIVCAIALAAGAAFFFGTSKKSAKEMM